MLDRTSVTAIRFLWGIRSNRPYAVIVNVVRTNVSCHFFSYLSSVFPIVYSYNFPLFLVFETVQTSCNSKLVSSYKIGNTSTRFLVCVVFIVYTTTFDKQFFRQTKSILPFDWVIWVTYNWRYHFFWRGSNAKFRQ